MVKLGLKWQPSWKSCQGLLAYSQQRHVSRNFGNRAYSYKLIVKLGVIRPKMAASWKSGQALLAYSQQRHESRNLGNRSYGYKLHVIRPKRDTVLKIWLKIISLLPTKTIIQKFGKSSLGLQSSGY